VSYQNRGYGTEAASLCLRYGFEELNLNRIALSVFSHNWRAIRLYQRTGFVHEGCLREAVYRHGQYYDEYRFAMLRDEWRYRNSKETQAELTPTA
jgi:RimJ/RimL family protein N-acetyltransferase